MVKIYSIIDPRNNTVKYIGKTITSLNRRLVQHISGAKNYRNKSRCYIWLRKLNNLNLKPIIQLIEEVEDNIWEDKEKYWINYYKDNDLVNTTPGGGVGCSGYNHTEKAKRMIGLANSRPKSKEWIENARLGMLKVRAIPILQYSFNGELLKEWESVCFAADFLGDPTRAKRKNITACCRNKRRSAYGYIWKYKIKNNDTTK